MLLRDKTERHALKGDRKPPWKGQNNKSTNVCDMNSGVSDVHCVTHLLHPQRRDRCVKSSLHKVVVLLTHTKQTTDVCFVVFVQTLYTKLPI